MDLQSGSTGYNKRMKYSLSIVPMLLFVGPMLGQQPAQPPSFEVAVIKPSNPANGIPGKGRALPGGRVELYGLTANDLVIFAYGV